MITTRRCYDLRPNSYLVSLLDINFSLVVSFTENVRKHNEAVEAATRSSMAHKINIQGKCLY